jgi:hypothetical protein
MTKSLHAKTVLLAACAIVPLMAQTPPPSTQTLPQFEVASIKPNKAGDNRVAIQIQPGGHFSDRS